MTSIRGVDGCKAGWLSVTLDLESGSLASKVHENAASLFRDGGHVVTAIDIPIGLPSRRARACDKEARTILGARKSSVFPPPVRAALGETTYEAACDASKAACDKALTKQAYAILPKIRDVDFVLRKSPELLGCVFEVHPEVCFHFMNEERPMLYSKKSGFGFAERYRRLDDWLPGAADNLRKAIRPSEAADDDILDALVALWTAERINAGTAVRLPSGPEEKDACGLPMQMLA